MKQEPLPPASSGAVPAAAALPPSPPEPPRLTRRRPKRCLRPRPLPEGSAPVRSRPQPPPRAPQVPGSPAPLKCRALSDGPAAQPAPPLPEPPPPEPPRGTAAAGRGRGFLSGHGGAGRAGAVWGCRPAAMFLQRRLRQAVPALLLLAARRNTPGHGLTRPVGAVPGPVTCCHLLSPETPSRSAAPCPRLQSPPSSCFRLIN